MIEEADAWFEYLEATRNQIGDALPRGRAVGVGSPEPALRAIRTRRAKLRPAAA